MITLDLTEMLGVEHRLADVSRSLRHHVRLLHAPVVGALHVTCADESEWECTSAFQRHFVNDLLPNLKFAEKAPFRLSNLGGRYELGAIPVAEHHFTSTESQDEFKVLFVKINAHVAVDGLGEQAHFGRMQRYDAESTACGALHALMAGQDQPFLDDLRAAFASQQQDRLAALLDEGRVDPRYRSLFAALVNARLQAHRAEIEIENHQPAGPTLYLVASCVTLNRAEEDTEILCGLYTSDQRGAPAANEYRGLGDDPTKYEVRCDLNRLRICDDQLPA